MCRVNRTLLRASRALERMGRIDTVVANAGIASLAPFVDMDTATYRRLIEGTAISLWPLHLQGGLLTTLTLHYDIFVL